jgi:hypothetical protein
VCLRNPLSRVRWHRVRGLFRASYFFCERMQKKRQSGIPSFFDCLLGRRCCDCWVGGRPSVGSHRKARRSCAAWKASFKHGHDSSHHRIPSGVYNAWRGLGGSSYPLPRAAWGRMLIVKVGIVLMAFSDGARVRPELLFRLRRSSWRCSAMSPDWLLSVDCESIAWTLHRFLHRNGDSEYCRGVNEVIRRPVLIVEIAPDAVVVVHCKSHSRAARPQLRSRTAEGTYACADS